MALTCTNCSADLPEGARFCSNCGTPTAAVAAAPTVAPAAVSAPASGAVAPAAPAPPTAPPARLAGERKPVTALFADVVGSVTLAERMDPEDWSALMSRALGEIDHAVRRYDGSIAKLLGDGVLALFGAETAHEDDPERAVRAAAEILEAFERLRSSDLSPVARELHVRIGINTGLALVGSVSAGDGDRADMSAYGDTVNVAARLQSAATPGRALLAASTFRLVAHAVDARDLGPILLKGRAEPVQVHELVGLRAAPDSPRGVEGLRSPMVGRRDQLALLERLVGELAAGRGRAAVVVGEPGIGKSRLLAELRARTEGLGAATWVEGRARSYGLMQADHLLVDLVRSLDRATPGDAAADPVLGTLLGRGRVPAADQPGEGIRAAYVTAIGELVRACAGQGPVVAVLEDLHWSDASSAESLADLLPAASTEPLLLIASTRDDREVPGWTLVEAMRRAYPEVDLISLAPLSDDDSRTLVANLLDIDALPSAVRDRIVARADGNPFFVEETLRMLIDRGLLVFREGRCVATAEIASVEIPETIHGLLLARIDRLPGEPRRVLRVASVIGREFSAPLLSDVLSTAGEAVSPESLADHLVDLQGAGLVRVVPSQDPALYRFRHALVQEAAYDSLLRAERTTLHGAVGAAMERGDPGTLDEAAARISEHFELAGDAARAYPWARRAADAAYGRYALPEAIAQFRRSIALAATTRRPAAELTELYLSAGRATELMDRYADAIALYVEMGDRALGLGDRRMELAAMAARATGEAISAATGGFDPATKEHALEALELARELGDQAVEAKVLWTLLLANRFGWGNDAEGIRYGRELLALAKSIGDEAQAALTAQDLAQILLATGELALARASFDESIGFWRRAGNLPLAANGLRVRGEAEHLMGELDAAETSYREALEIDETTGNVWGRAISRMGLGVVLVDGGRHREGIPLIEEARDIADGSDLTILHLIVLSAHAWAQIVTGRTDIARGLLEGFDPSAAEMFPDVNQIPRALVAELELAEGRPDAARAMADPGTAFFRVNPFAYTVLPLWAAPLEAALAVGEAEHVLPIAREIRDRVLASGARAWEPAARRNFGLALRQLGQAEEGDAELRVALDVAREVGLPHEVAAVEAALAGSLPTT